jgi:MFS family permease
MASLFMKDSAHTGIRRKSFLIKRKYSLFYILALLFGVRKQLFLVFGPWMLIRIFDQGAPEMARLAIVSAATGFFVKPWLGKCIDRFGERKTLMADASVLFLICLVYALAEKILPSSIALILLFVCYVIDDCLFSLRSAHVTYLSRIVDSPDELTVSISTSYSIEHVVSMLAPPVAGFVWITWGYSWVFAVAATVAIMMFAVSSMIPEYGKDGDHTGC